MYLEVGTSLKSTKDDPMFFAVSNFRGLEWFRPPGYQFSCSDRCCYGRYLGEYVLNSRLNLLNLGSSDDRKLVLDNTSLTGVDINPDNQYCGHDGNLKVHKAILGSVGLRRYDGTIITKEFIEEKLLDDLEGADEVVLFTSRVRNRISYTGYT